MPEPASASSTDKFRRYRSAQRARGMRMLRVWIPDTRAAGFRAEALRQAELLRGAPEEQDALDFIEVVAARDLDGL